MSALLLLFLTCNILTIQAKVTFSADERKWLSENREITFVSQTSYAPFEFIDKEQRSDGMSIELARWIATEAGFKAHFIDMSFQEAQKAVLEGRADVLTSFFYSDQRAESFNFTPMSWEVPALIFVPNERPDIKEIEDLRGKTVAMQRGDFAEEFLINAGISYNEYSTDSFIEAVEAVINGQADALIGDKQIVLYELYKQNNQNKLKSVGPPLYTGQNGMATRKDNIMLHSILEKGMIRARELGIIDKITGKWLGINYYKEKSWVEKNLILFLIILAVVILTVLIIIFWNIQLRVLIKKKTGELKRSELQLRAIFNTIPNMIWIKDPKGLYLNCNPEFEKFFNAEEAEIIGKTDYDFLPKPLADTFRDNDRELIKQGGIHKDEETVTYASDGHVDILEATKTPFFDENGNLYGVLGIAHSIKERVESEIKLRENEAFLGSIFDNIPDMVLVKDALTRQYLRINRAAEKHFDMTASQIRGKRIEEISCEENALLITALEKQVIETKKMVEQTDFALKKPGKDETILHWKAVPVYGADSESIQYIMEIFTDITEKTRNEHLLKLQRDLALSLNTKDSSEQVLLACLEAVFQIKEVTAGGLYLRNDQTGSLDLVHESVKGLPDSFIRKAETYSPESPHYKLAAEGKPIYKSYEDVLKGLKNISDEQREFRLSTGLKAMGIIPFMHNNSIIGCLNIASHSKNSFSQYTEFCLEAVMSQTSETLKRIISSEELKNSKQNFQTLFNSINDFLFILGEDGIIQHWNPVVEQHLGYSPEKLQTMNVLDVHPPERREEAQDIVQEMLKGNRVSCPIPLLTAEKELFPVETIISTGLWNGKPAIFGVSRDITERLRYEDKIHKALKEKEVLLKEIHHRVKNNLQVVTSLLSLQSYKISSEEAKTAFREAQTQIRSMSLVHEVLYQSTSLDSIDLQKYLEKLSTHMIRMFLRHDVDIRISAQDVILNIHKAVPCGIIITELITNALKYAFNEQKTDNILDISFKLTPGNTIKAVIYDNGGGLPADVNPKKVQSLGLQLLIDLVEDQLEGTWQLERDNGTRWTLEWPAG